ncbi:hypothetical protein C2E23DRAFT_271956 [Lenzites betulinus]|nr:hypothetical protein C2E23DRAFT_271956 [Lenzites betulinus]
MPRFLDTFTGEFRWIVDPSTISYAILSHTWRSEKEGGEQSYADVRQLWLTVAAERATRSPPLGGDSDIKDGASSSISLPIPTDTDILAPEPGPDKPVEILSHPGLCDKIKGVCKIAREAGYRLVWVDSCCIDKSSSAELAETINMMFELYRQASVCYVYLADILDVSTGLRLPDSKFYRCRWHTRGWTLQELLAPKHVVFLTASWVAFGTKMSFATTLQRITGIEFNVLTGRAPLSSVSVASRMSWAASRQTTRVEDEAYSLLGIFGVHMPPIYGEGRNAFLRLQEEIIKTIPDQSIFAWGATLKLHSLNSAGSDQESSSEPTLLAPSPRSFYSPSSVLSLSPRAFLERLRMGARERDDKLSEDVLPPLHCVFTPQGVRLQLLCVDLTSIPAIADMFVPHWSFGRPEQRVGECVEPVHRVRAHLLALLRCGDSRGGLLALALFRPEARGEESRGMYIGTHAACDAPQCPFHPPYRLVRIQSEDVLHAIRSHILPTPIEVFLLRDLSGPFSGSVPREHLNSTIPINLWPTTNTPVSRDSDSTTPGESLTTFRLAPDSEIELGSLECTISPLICTRPDDTQIVLTTFVTAPPEMAEFTFKLDHRQVLQITVALTHVPNREETRWNTRVQFTVDNLFHVPEPSGEDDSADARDATGPSEPGCSFCGARRCKVWPAPYAEREYGNRTLLITDRAVVPERVVAQAEFNVHIKAEINLKDGVMQQSWYEYMRLLRLTLECPPHCFEEPTSDIKELWLSVGLSEAWYAKNPLGEPPPLKIESYEPSESTTTLYSVLADTVIP